MISGVKFPAALLLAAAVTVGAAAGTVRFRSGRVLDAEISDRAPEISPGNEYVALKLPVNRAYAAVTVKIDAGRGISIYDYQLKSFGVPFPCAAIRAEREKFNDAVWKIEPADPAKKYTLLFIVDGKQLNPNASEEEMTLVSALSEDHPLAETVLKFRRVGSSALTAPESVSDRGRFPEERLP